MSGERDRERGPGDEGRSGSARAGREPEFEGPSCPAPLGHEDHIVLGHGSGGTLTADLIARLFIPLLGNTTLLAADDAAVLEGIAAAEPAPAGPGGQAGGTLAVTTDAHVVTPLFFPGGDIGRLSVCGTVNDLAMVGAQPRWIAASFILEEGFSVPDLERIVRSMRAAADEAGVQVVAGDTKVAERGKVDGLYITTTGVGLVPAGRASRAANLRAGDAVIVSGPLGDHGIAVLAARGGLAFQTAIVSDVAPLSSLVEAMFATGAPIHALRDLTRGGLAAALNELAGRSGVGIVIREEEIPVRPEVRAACEMLGFDPLHVANEGKLVAFVPDDHAERMVAAMRHHPLGGAARIIGRVEADPRGRVVMETALGAARIVDTPAGELLPRIC